MYVRTGNLGDIPWILEELEEFQNWFGSKKPLFDKESAPKIVETWIEKHLVFIAEKDTVGQIGFIIGAITPHLFNPKLRMLAELLWWVDPLHRHTRAGHELLSEFVHWGRNNVDWITFSLQDITPVKETTLKRFGFRHLEHCYLIETGCKYGCSSSPNSDSDDSSIDSSSRSASSGIEESEKEG